MPLGAPASIFFIINPISGGRTKEDWESAIREYYKPLSQNPEFFFLTGADDISSIRHWIEKIQPEKSIVFRNMLNCFTIKCERNVSVWYRFNNKKADKRHGVGPEIPPVFDAG